MKRLLLISALLTIFTSCHKEHNEEIPIIPGQSYNIKADHYIFNKGAFQPLSPALVTDLFISPSGTPYAHIMAAVNWNDFALKSGNGVAEQTVQGNKLTMASFPAQGLEIGDHKIIEWSIPQWDLTDR
jgi:hypothetical protein